MFTTVDNFIYKLGLLSLYLMFISLGLSKGIANISMVAFIILSIYKFDYASFKKNIFRYKHIVAFGLFVLMLLAGLIYSDFMEGLLVVKQNIRFLLIPLVFVANHKIIKNHYKGLLTSFVAATSLASLFTVVLYFLPEEMVCQISNLTPFMQPYEMKVSRLSFGLYSPFYERIQLSNMVGLSFIFCLFFIWKGYKKMLFIVLSILLIYTSMMLGGRGGQLALLGGTFTLSIMLAYRKYFPMLEKKLGSAVAVSTIFLLVTVIFFITPVLIYNYNSAVKKRYNQMKWELETFYGQERNNYTYEHFTSVRRLVSWKNTWKIIKENPIIGVGTGDYRKALSEVYERDGYEFSENTHSQYLYLWAMLGVLGLSGFMGLLIFWLSNIKKSKKMYVLAVSFFIFYLVSMIPDSVLTKQIDNQAFIMFVSLIGIVGVRKK